MKENIIKITLADDHAMLREALANLMNSFEEARVIQTVGNGLELIASMENNHIPDVVVLDLNMPKMDGFKTAEWLHEKHPQVKVLVLTMYDSEIALIRLLKHGVRAFLKKDAHPKELRLAINAVAGGGYYYSHDTTGKLATLFQMHPDGHSFASKAMLTDPEMEFLKLASTDLTYKEIAHQLKLTPRTIDGYRDSLFEKLDVKSRVGLAIYAVRNGIVTL